MDVYHDPKEFGLELVWSVDTADSYEFNIFAVWADLNLKNEPNGARVFIGTDTGCSCPSPFENVQSVEELERVENIEHLRRAVSQHDRVDQNTVRACLSAVRAVTGWA